MLQVPIQRIPIKSTTKKNRIARKGSKRDGNDR